MYKKIAFVLILGLVLVFFSRFGYAADNGVYYDPYRYDSAPQGYANPHDYDYDPYDHDYGHPYGNSYPYGYYQQAPPWEGDEWQINERQLYEEQKQLHKEYGHGEVIDK